MKLESRLPEIFAYLRNGASFDNQIDAMRIANMNPELRELHLVRSSGDRYHLGPSSPTLEATSCLRPPSLDLSGMFQSGRFLSWDVAFGRSISDTATNFVPSLMEPHEAL